MWTSYYLLDSFLQERPLGNDVSEHINLKVMSKEGEEVQFKIEWQTASERLRSNLIERAGLTLQTLTHVNRNDLVVVVGPDAMYAREGNKETFDYRKNVHLALHEMLR